MESPETRNQNENERQPKNTVERYRYNAEDGVIELGARKFFPKNESKERLNPTEAVIFIPGYGMDADNPEIDDLSQSLADYSESQTFVVSTIPEQSRMKDSLAKQAKSISRYIAENNLQEITLTGYSQGGDKSIDLIAILQKNHPEIKIKGLVLIDSMGLYEQDTKILKRFLKDSLNMTWDAIKHAVREHDLSYLKKTINAGNALAAQAWKRRGNIRERMTADFEDMAKMNEKIQEVAVPVVLVQGEQDEVSEYEKIIPEKESLNKGREKYLKENLFKSSPYVRMLVAEKKGTHGLPVARGESVAKTSLYMIDRFNRAQARKEEQQAA
jgi:pimeloyl-ACP methyl ester carboxylesterase